MRFDLRRGKYMCLLLTWVIFHALQDAGFDLDGFTALFFVSFIVFVAWTLLQVVVAVLLVCTHSLLVSG